MIKFINLLLILLFAVACMDNASRKGKPTIDDFESLVDTDGPVVEETHQYVSRPTKEVFLQSDFCACVNGKSDIMSNCDATCAGKANTADPTLYVKASLGETILLNETLGSLKKWCEGEIDDGNASPKCFLRIQDRDGSSEDRPVNVATNSNLFTASLANLSYNKTYHATLVEITSGAVSDTIQFIRMEPSTTDTIITGPLKTTLVSQYTCMQRSGSSAGPSFENVIRQYYYFTDYNVPAALPATAAQSVEPFIFCHDINLFGNWDKSTFERLEHIPDHFIIWDQSDRRLYDTNGNGKLDVNELIENEIKRLGFSTSGVNLFSTPLQWPNMPTTSDSTLNVKPNIGYWITPFTDSLTGRSYCPTRVHYTSSDPIAKALGNVVGVETEGIFLAVKEAETLFDENGMPVTTPPGIMLIREGLLKKIWFYIQNGNYYQADAVTATQKSVMFHWPANPDSPYVKTADQRLYTIRSPQELSEGTSGSELRTNVPTTDKRLGCIPKHPDS